MKRIFLILSMISFILSNGIAQEANQSFLSKKQLYKLYDDMIHEIEQLDAEGIEVRNKTKDVNWTRYKKHHRKQFKKATSYSQLKQKFKAFGNGFVCGHSDFEFLYPVEKGSTTAKESNIKIGFTYPKISFFDLASKQTITKINGQAIDKAFKQFLNYQTANNTINDCQIAFKRKFEKGSLLIRGKTPKYVTFEDGVKKPIIYVSANKVKSTYQEVTEGIDIQEKYQHWKKVKQGYKVAVLQKDDVAMIKIKDFVYLKGRGGDINCQAVAADSTHCGDVQIIRKGLSEIIENVNYLIIDLQGNYGGQENTRFIAELCPNEFYDLSVQYRKTALLEDEALRAYLFYNSERAENWYQNLRSSGIYNETKLGDFLPARADFCRGDSLCQLTPISPNQSYSKKFEEIIVLVNEGTASSGDDFTYRMKEYGGALVAGQPQSADLTYSLVGVLFYLNPNGQIEQKYVGNRQRKYKVDGTELFKFSVPYSKTVNKNGQLLQGNPLKLDLEVELTKDNFTKREESVANAVIQKLVKKK